MSQGSFPIPISTQDFTVPYGFAMVPTSIVPSVNNVSADPTIEIISAIVVGKALNGFVVHLSAPTPTANYTLDWWSSDLVVVGQPARSFGSLSINTATPSPFDWFMFQSTANGGQIARAEFSTLYNAFANFVPTPPTNSTDPGVSGQWSMDALYFYAFTGQLWGRIPLDSGNWNIDPALNGMISVGGTVAIPSAQSSITVNFSSQLPFVPNVTFSFSNTVSTNVAVLTGIITTCNANLFTITFNSPTPDANYSLVWNATFPTAASAAALLDGAGNALLDGSGNILTS